MFEEIKNIIFGSKKSRTFGAITKVDKHKPVWTPKQFQDLARNGYRNNVYVYACIRKIAESCSGINWILYKNPKTKKAKIKEIENHPLLNVWNQPNPMQSLNKFIENVVAYLLLEGNSYIEQIKIKGLPRELYTLRPDRMKIIPGDSKRYVRGYIYTVGTEKVPFEAEDILHMLMFDPLNDWLGMSPLYAASESLDQNNESRAWNVSLLQNGGQPPGILKTHPDSDELTDRQYDRLVKKWIERHGGQKNAGLPIILEGGLDWQGLSMTANEMAWEEGIKMSAKEICIAYQVPPELLGDTANKTYSNYKEARASFYEETILPLMDWIKGEINRWFTKQFDDSLQLDYDRDDIEALQESRDKVWARIDNSKELTINEKRVAKGYEEISNEDGGKIILVESRSMDLKSYIETDLKQTQQSNEESLNQNPDEEFEETSKEDAEKAIQFLSKKSVDLKTKQAKKDYVKYVETIRNKYYKASTKVIQKNYDKQRKMIVKKIKGSTVKTVINVVNKELSLKNTKTNIGNLLSTIYLTTAEPFVDYILDSVKDKKSTFMIYNTKEQSDWKKEVLDWLSKNSSTKIVSISETVREQVRNELTKGVNNDESIEELAARIDTLYLKQIIPNRSTVIARTEVVSASNLGSRIGAKQSGYDMTKEWLSTNDARTRDSHRRALGQSKDLDKPYIVDGEKLMFPGDSSLGASPENVIQCRCTETYNLKD